MTELFLIARIAGRGVAVPADQVVSAVDIGEIVGVPGAPPAIRGLAALRSRVVTVVDTAIALGERAEDCAGNDDGCRAVITKVEDHDYAFLVDTLEDVGPFDRQALSAGMALGGGWAAAGRGLVERDGEPLLVLDLAALVPAMAAAA